MLCRVGRGTQTEVGQRAHGQGQLRAHKVRHERLVLRCADAVVDAGYAEIADALPHVGGRALLPCMRGEAQATRCRVPEVRHKERGRVPNLVGVQPKADDPPLGCVCLLVVLHHRLDGTPPRRLDHAVHPLVDVERVLWRSRRRVSQEAGDQESGQALTLCLLKAVEDAGCNVNKADPPACVGLWVKKELRVHHTILQRTLTVRICQVLEVLPRFQHNRHLVVHIKERRQVFKVVSFAELFHRVPWKVRAAHAHAIALGQGKRQRGFQRAFQVEMQLRLGHAL
mmetsp:Transcript_48683/g.122491  ORF Transcript_48683/g.122491 Transcript_48683/m.122491 type:complete len:283 (+) Transcript_48683:2304-3152(+)